MQKKFAKSQLMPHYSKLLNSHETATEMKPTLVSMFDYKAWANQLLLSSLHDLAAQITVDRYRQILAIYDHAQVVDAIFQAHLQIKPHAWRDTQSTTLPSLTELKQSITACDAWYCDFVGKLSEADLAEVRHFKFTDGLPGSMSVQEILWHVLSHATYHRGSMAQILEDLGFASPADSLSKFLHYTQTQRRCGTPA